MVNLFNYLVYRKFKVADEYLLVAGFRDKESAEEYVKILKKIYPFNDYYIKDMETVRNP